MFVPRCIQNIPILYPLPSVFILDLISLADITSYQPHSVAHHQSPSILSFVTTPSHCHTVQLSKVHATAKIWTLLASTATTITTTAPTATTIHRLTARRRGSARRTTLGLDKLIVNGKHFPKFKVLIRCTTAHGLTIRTDSHVQDTGTVRIRNFHHLLHRRVLPDDQLIVSETMRGDQFLVRLGPEDARYLRSGIDARRTSTR